MSEQVMKDLEDKVNELAEEFKAYAMKKLKHVEASGVGLSQDHQEHANNWITPRHFVAAVSQEYAEQVMMGKLTKQGSHTIKQYRIHM
jgi:hypothetical protein